MSIISENNTIPVAEDFHTRKVVEANDLISSIAKMDKTPLKIFELAVSYIDTENPPKDNVVYLSKKELFSFFKVSDNNKHSRFKQAVEVMQKQAYFQVKKRANNKKGFKFKSIVPIPTVEWNDYNDKVYIRFNEDIMPYLIDLKEKFTQYAISDIMELEYKYSITIYKWLCMHYNQFEHYQHKTTRTNKQLEAYRNPKISIEELRNLTDTVNEYSRFDNFEARVIKSALKEINKFTHFNVTYEKEKKGRTIEAIQFHIDKKKTVKDEAYKKEDQPAQLSAEQKQKLNESLFYSAVGNPYTLQLINIGLLQPTDITNQERLIGLATKVYPTYDKISQKKGKNGLTTHLEYVRDKMVDFTESKKNIVKYLKTSAEQYINSTSFD